MAIIARRYGLDVGAGTNPAKSVDDDRWLRDETRTATDILRLSMRLPRLPRLSVLLAALLVVPAAGLVSGDSWPEWRGPGPDRRLCRNRPPVVVVADR